MSPAQSLLDLVLRCKHHPTYGAMRKPRVECQTCWHLYRLAVA